MNGFYFDELPSERFTIQHQFKKCIAVTYRKNMEKPAAFPYRMMKANGGNDVAPVMPIEAIGKYFSCFMIAPKDNRDGFIDNFGHIVSIINPKIQSVNNA